VSESDDPFADDPDPRDVWQTTELAAAPGIGVTEAGGDRFVFLYLAGRHNQTGEDDRRVYVLSDDAVGGLVASVMTAAATAFGRDHMSAMVAAALNIPEHLHQRMRAALGEAADMVEREGL